MPAEITKRDKYGSHMKKPESLSEYVRRIMYEKSLVARDVEIQSGK